MSENRAFLEVIAPDVEEAIARGLFELGLEEEDVDIEVLDDGDAREGRQARVRITVRPPEQQPEDETAAAARQILQELLSKMKVRGRVSARWGETASPNEEAPLILDVQGDDLGLLIGHRGETLASLQYLVRLMVGKKLNKMVNLVVDVEGFKRRREEQLRRLANRLADQAANQGRTISLEPMPPNERRIIHLTLRDHPDVTTQSVGEGRARKVTVVPKAKKRS